MEVAKKSYILIIEKEEFSATELERIVRKINEGIKGFEPTVVKSLDLNDAVRRMDACHFKVIISEFDLKCGNITKLLDLKKTTKENKKTPLVVVTDNLDREKEGTLMLNKIEHYFQKPVDKEKFLELVAFLFNKKEK